MRITYGTRGRPPRGSEHDLTSLLAALVVFIVITDILLTRAL
jgi:hypothetical protein